jgi:hypothetical protein
LLGQVQGVAARGAYALARDGRLSEAVGLLERGLGVLTAERMAGLRVSLDRARAAGHAAEADAYDRAAAVLARLLATRGMPAAEESGLRWEPVAFEISEQASPTAEDMALAVAALGAARARLEEVAGPLLPEGSSAEVAAAATAGQPVVYLLATEVGGLALTVTGDGQITPIWLDELTTAVVDGWARHLDELTSDPPSQDQRATTSAVVRGRGRGPDPEEVDDLVEQLGTVLRPLVDWAPGLAGLRLVPVGELARLPVPAAVALTGPAIRPVSVALSARLHALAGHTAARVGTEAVPGEVAAVTDPDPCTRPDGTPLRRLPGARAEGEWLASRCGARHHTGENATKATVADLLARGCAVLHLAAHGATDPLDPLRSHVLLCDGSAGHAETLTLAELIHTTATPRDHTPPTATGTLTATGTPAAAATRLAFLAACWLAHPGHTLPDEAIAFPTVLLETGTAAVIAPLWPVDDTACRHLVETFYEGWLAGESPAQALADAQHKNLQVHPHSATWAAFSLTGT